MKHQYFILLALLPFSLFSCKTEKYSASNLPEIRLSFGNGGGFAGAYTEYILLENGQIFKQEGIRGSMEEFGKIKKSKAKKIFQQLEEAEFPTLKRDAPGNMYRFMSCQTSTSSNKVTWGSHEKVDLDDKLDSLYQECMKLIEGNKK